MHMEATDPPHPIPAPPRPPARTGEWPRPLLLRLYLAGSRRAAGIARRLLERRRAQGKEDAARLPERMGQASGGEAPPEFSSTHPNPGTRIQNLQALMPKAMEYRKKFCEEAR